MKIAIYNINGINGRLPILLRWLKEAEPDIVCLQELKAENHRFPEEEIKQAGYQAIWKGQKSWNGVAILSKTEITEILDTSRAKIRSSPIAATSRLSLGGCLSPASICLMEILIPGRSSTINFVG